MPRTKVADPRRNVTIRLSDAERGQLDRAAQRAGQPVARFARSRLLADPGAAAAAPSMATERHRQTAAALAEQLRRIGVNLNQLVHHVNAYPDERVPADAALILGQIRELVRQARAL